MSDHVKKPRRPTLSFLLYGLAGVICVERAVLAGGDARVLAAGIASAALVAVALLAGVGRRNEMVEATCRVALSACAACIVGCVLAARVVGGGLRFERALTSSPVSSWAFAVEGEGTPTTRGGYRCRARAFAEGMPQGEVWLQSDEQLVAGSVVSCVGRFSPLGEDEWSRSSRMQGVWGTVRVLRIERMCSPAGPQGMLARLREDVLGSMRGSEAPVRGLLAGCVCGSRAGLRTFGLDELFSRCGVAHLVAVSGGHLAILSTMLGTVLEQAHVRPRGRFALLAVASGLFVLLCGAPVSAVRAWAMTVVGMGAVLAGRRAHALSGVGAVGLVMALVDPTVSGQLGFVLSVVSVCGLCVFSPYAAYVLDVLLGRPLARLRMPRSAKRRLRRAERGLRASLTASLVAQAVTLPITAATFGELSLVGPVASMVVAVPFSAFVGTGLVAACLWWAPSLQRIVLVPCDLLGEFILAVLRVLSKLPHAVLVVEDATRVTAVVVALLALVLLAWPTVSRGALMGAAAACALAGTCLFVRWRYMAPACVRVLDVGQGDAILVQDGSGALLVDAGPESAVGAGLARGHVMHLDALLITHLHADHYAGIADLVGRVECDRVLVAQGTAAHVPEDLAGAIRELTGRDPEEVSYGEVLHVGSFDLRVVWPTKPAAGTENADSVELALTYDDGTRTLSGLLTGDAERDETGSVLLSGDVGDVDFLKVGHHGSEVSLTQEQACELDPEVSVASAGAGNSYGHPREECVSALEGAGSRFLCTKDVGDVEIRPGEGGPVVLTQR